MANLTIVQAINLALKQEMARDPAVMLLGEDIGKDGGVFRATEGLWEQFGDDRVVDTPLAESAIVGTSIGLAIMGMKPIAEIQFDGFTYPALDHLISHAGRLRVRSQGKMHVPMVLRAPYGGGIKALEHHSESPEAYFAHTPGIKCVIPSNPYDAKGLLVASIRDPDPVVFLEPKRIYRSFREEVPDEDYAVPIGKAKVAQEGSDLTIIAYGSMLKFTQDVLAKANLSHSIELIDVRTITPLDKETLVGSVKKTGRALIVQEAPRSCGFAAEIAAMLMGTVFLSLEAPVVRVTGFDIPYPVFKAEQYYLPTQEKILAAIDSVMSY